MVAHDIAIGLASFFLHKRALYDLTDNLLNRAASVYVAH